MTLYTRYRRAKYLLWAVTREDRPDRRIETWIDLLHRMNLNESWTGLRFRAGALRDARGRFVNPDNQKEISA